MLKKVESGLLEHENFYMTCNLEDFLGNAIYSRTLDYFELKSGEVKRRFPDSPSFVLDVKKDPKDLQDGDKIIFFLENEYGKIGITEKFGQGENVTDWRIIFHDGFIQTYKSIDDGKTWTNIGGREFLGGRMLYQGFAQEGSTFLTIRDYKLYKSPYLTIQNFTPGHVAKLYDKEGNFLKERAFQDDMTAKIFLDHEVEGYLQIVDPNGQEVYKSQNMTFVFGDVFLYTPYLLELIYNGKGLDYRDTFLNEYNGKFILRNLDIEAYENINLRVDNPTNDDIQISLDGTSYGVFKRIDIIEALSEKDIYFKILKNESSSVFNVKDFTLEIF